LTEIEGWLTPAQAARLAACGARAGGQVVEIGSFRGRSTVVLARAAGSVVAIDPHAGSDRGPQEIAADAARGDSDFEVFTANVAAAGVSVRHIRKFSADAHGDVEGPIALLYVDGAHRFGPARADLRDWGDRVVGGGTMLVHDSFSSIGVTLALFTRRGGRYVGRTGSLAEFRRERGRLYGPMLRQLPWFARNVAIKVLIVAGRRSWAERLGLDRAAPWPY
jgi:hypothetical protein